MLKEAFGKKLLLVIAFEAVVLSCLGVLALAERGGSVLSRYTAEIILSIPLFYTFSILKAGVHRPKLGEQGKRMLIFLALFAALLALSGLLSGLGAAALYALLAGKAALPEIVAYISWFATLVTCLLYPLLAGFFVSLAQDTKNYLQAGLVLAKRKYFILLLAVLLAAAAGRLAAGMESAAGAAVLSAFASAACITFTLAILSGEKAQEEEQR